MSGSLMALSFSPTTQLVFPSSFSGATFRKHRYNSAPPLQIQTQTKTTQCIAAVFSTQTATTPTATTSTSTSKKLSVSTYLMEKLGFSDKEAVTASAKVIIHRTNSNSKSVTNLISYENANTVITYLQDVGLDLSHVKKLVSKFPVILRSNVDKTIKPKVKLLQDLGFSTPDLAHVLSVNPQLYLSCNLSPTVQALRGIMGSDENVVRFFRRSSYGNTTHMNYIIHNVEMLENEYGIPRDKVRKLMTSAPNALMWRIDLLRDVLVKIEDKWGISRDSTVFLTAVFTFGCFSDENIDSKCQVFRSFGWSESDIKSFIRRHPTFFKYSVTRTKKSLEFYVNELGFEPAYLAARPSFFSYSLENRVLPRHKVLSILKEKGLIKADYQLYSALNFSDDRFFEKFIQRFVDDVPNLREVYIYGNTQ